ncbi:hypothetical protein BDY21DRAFT_386814 [Lineolata rhizophorae]|uniref:Fe2OG dioxygenase domain-containing protein n=1 Tax=Lineolata rhizophorae TaxID=578093 RepID=A0A6A6NW58_9PEZI|nr:hypothetical protein BDY21DRAFT_386814 [Lineolata rhizophorae]
MAADFADFDLSQRRISSLTPEIFYIPNFISADEEAQLLGKIPPNRWIVLTHRRLQAHPSQLARNNTLLRAPLPPWLTDPVVPRFERLGIFSDTPHRAPNHVLLNEYKPGEGIMPHEDGLAYAGVVATVSLGSTLVLDIYSKRDGTRMKEPKDRSQNGPKVISRILQEPRSLLVTKGGAYADYLHGIAPVTQDTDLNPSTVANWSLLGNPTAFESGTSKRETRISLTYRDVLKVSDAASRILGKKNILVK